MKRIYILFILLFISVSSFSQNGTIKVVKPVEESAKDLIDSSKSQIITIPNGQVQTEAQLMFVEEMPEFPGGKGERNKFINKNINYPKAERDTGISGFCHVFFAVEADGSLTDIKISKGVPKCPNCDKEALRVVSMMPKWSPGKQNGQAVKVYYGLQIGFPLK